MTTHLDLRKVQFVVLKANLQGGTKIVLLDSKDIDVGNNDKKKVNQKTAFVANVSSCMHKMNKS